MVDSNDIDVVDYVVLWCIQKNGSCWKKRVHRCAVKNIDRLPMKKSVSTQTISRHIDTLHEKGLLDNGIIEPEETNRDLIIGYTLTEKGEKALEAKQNEFLRKMVVSSSKELLTEHTYDHDADASIDREALVALMSDVFNIDEETRTEVLSQIETAELLGLLATHFFLDNAVDLFNPDNEEVISVFLERTPKFRRPFEKKNIIARIRERLTAQAESVSENLERTP